MQKVYISGKISGLDMENEVIPKFAAAEEELKSLGYEPVNPLKIDACVENPQWEDYMKADIVEMLKCDKVYALSCWHKSKGAKIEIVLASQLGLEVIFDKIDRA